MTLSWIAPFTLDVPRLNPDIHYCILLKSIDKSSPPEDKCEVKETSFTFDMSERFYGKYQVTVTPYNIVGRGKSNSLLISWDKGKAINSLQKCVNVHVQDLAKCQAY